MNTTTPGIQPPGPQAAAEIRAAVNGAGPSDIIRVGPKGRRKFQMGDSPVVELDVLAVQNAWVATDRQYRDQAGQVPPDKRGALTKASYDFVCAIFGITDERQCSIAMALEFLAVITRETKELARFFEVNSEPESSSPGNSASIVYERTDGPSES